MERDFGARLPIRLGVSALLLVAFACGGARAEQTTLAQGPYRLEIVVEKQNDSGWQIVTPDHVFEREDQVRFRIQANFPGYLYVTNRGTSGSYKRLFPAVEGNEDNQVRTGQEATVPPADGSFGFEGPPGHEVLYWMVVPVELERSSGAGQIYEPLPPPPDRPATPSNLLPRCDETVLRARGECVDRSAGLKGLADQRSLAAATPQSDTQSPLLFLKKKNSSVIAAPPANTVPVIFEFRLAHR
jgi:hypothetical protein